ncbi:sce7726 family protein [Desulfitobacterium sp. THU1]|uniref:sce7726 family protein n=1 Tax=Desulfitobacterium sp. THU1 TaxID=3138072 RepID=UPI00311FAFDE
MAAQNLILNKLFTQNIFQKLLNDNNNSTYSQVVRRYVIDPETKNNGELISEVYSFMSASYRNEYVYQNTLLNKLLLGKHSINTTTALTQIPIGKSKADFILINGKAVVYEIKTELDSFERLDTQLRDYYKAFNHVCVVTSASNFTKISAILQDTPVGIYVLTKKNAISKRLRKEPAEDNSQLNHLAMFKLLHKGEYEQILKRFFGRLPVTSQVFYYDECFSWFARIPIEQAYSMSLQELKKRNKIEASFFQSVPYELKSLIYFLNPVKKEFEALNRFLNQKFGG